MSDVAVVLKTNGRYGITMGDDGDLIADDGLETAIYLSLLTDARSETVLTPEQRRGWLGNLVSKVDDRQLGGFLWLIEQRRLTQATLNDSIDYARKSLAWIVEDGLATSVEVTGAIVPRLGVRLAITITSLLGVTESHYVNLWEATLENAN